MNGTVDIDLDHPEISADVLGAMMLWPSDPKMRASGIATSMIKRTAEALRQSNQPLAPDEAADLVRLARDVTPLATMAKAAEQPFVFGVCAGFYLRETIGLVSLDRPTWMKVIAGRIATGLLPDLKGHYFQATIWPMYRPVSHFWAAALHLNAAMIEQDRSAYSATPFPCSPNQLTQFLGHAEGLRELGKGRERSNRLSASCLSVFALKFLLGFRSNRSLRILWSSQITA